MRACRFNLVVERLIVTARHHSCTPCIHPETDAYNTPLHFSPSVNLSYCFYYSNYLPIMTTLVPRAPYTQEELATLYPSDLELQQVQVILRHGERTPVNSRFKNVRSTTSPLQKRSTNTELGRLASVLAILLSSSADEVNCNVC
jgi:hypothetical protein